MALSVVYFQVTHRLGRPHYVWDEYLYSILEEVEVRMALCGKCLCSVGWWWWWWWKEGRRWNPVPAHSLLFLKSNKGAARLNVPIWRTNRYQQYYMPSQHMYCGRVWNLMQALMYNLVIRKCTSPPLRALRLKIFKWKFTTWSGSNPRPAEPEADRLPSEPEWQLMKKCKSRVVQMGCNCTFPSQL